MVKKRMVHSAAAAAVVMVVFMVMMVCAPRATMAADAVVAGSVTLPGPVSYGVSASTADSLNTSTATATSVGNATGVTTINGASVNINNANGLTTNIAAGAAATTNIGFAGGTNNIIGTTSINASINNTTNINTGTSTGAVTIGNSTIGTTNTVTALSGNSVLSIANTQASLTAGAGLATNGTSGTSSGVGSGGLTVYNTAQTISSSTESIHTTLSPNGILYNKTYQNKINGNLFVDGNVYINGTLDYVSSTSANTTVVGNTSTSNLSSTQGTTAGTAIVMKGSPGTQTVVDANGKLTNVATTSAAQSTAALTLTNGDGNTHGIVVTETQTTMSGGRNSTSLTLHDDGATFANSTNGQPVRVHGVDDGTAPYDAVNVRQLSAGLAMVAGLAALPQVDAGKKFAIGIGTGGYMSQVSLAGGLSARIMDNFMVKAGAAFVPDYSGNSHAVWNAGLQYSF